MRGHKNKIVNYGRFLPALVAFAVVGCTQRVSKTDKLRLIMEKYPPTAPLSRDDISDPQMGYYHQAVGISGGNYIRIKAGDPIRKELDESKYIKFKSFNLWEKDPPEIFSGFKPGYIICEFGKREKDKWVCMIFRTRDELKAYLVNQSRTHPVPLITCTECKPKPNVALSRICPGIYMSPLTSDANWEDPTRPGPKFNSEGKCTYEKPWWQTDVGLRLGVKSYGDEI